MDETVNKSELFGQLSKKIGELTSEPMPVSETLHAICDMLKTIVPAYDWVGFYLVDRENKRELVLGPYVGAPTEHVRIPFGEGVCGQAAERKETIIIQDVSREDNYLSCSTEVQSEIVVPIFKDGELIGEIDIDSHEVASFSDDDTSFLKSAAEMVARIL
jgi:GAF domain-containing protein